ncbi:MAG: hypothetical protein NUV51_06390 [Sulfuricaulis sp.]|nr:hypothetical protein [Sulfuricaulis sp.]
MRFLIAAHLGAALLGCSGIVIASSPAIPLPIDMESQAMQLDTLCMEKAPDLKPPYLERFQAWKERLGPYYSKYQQWLYESSVLQFPKADRTEKLKELKAEMEQLQKKRLKELKSSGREAYELCHGMADAISDPKHDAQLRRLVDEQNHPK